MGIGGISIWQLLIVLAIIVLLFGTKKLRNIGGDLGNAVKGFKKAVKDEPSNDTTETTQASIEAEDSSASIKPEQKNESKQQDKG